jgi:poly(A) polymerase
MKSLVSSIRSHLPSRDVFISLAEFAAQENVQLYLVGGTVRDLILGKEVEDLDFAVAGNASDFARKFADATDASFVPLDEERDTVRVVFSRGRFQNCPYMDFSRISGANITEDLAARDFTINAMAMDLSQIVNTSAHEVEVIDPWDGADDLDRGLIRLVSARSINDDPLRMLRAYRFAAILGFTVHDETSAIIQNSLDLLGAVSTERIREELFKTLSVDNSAHYLKAMDAIGLLEQIFPEIARTKGMEQNEYHHLDVWGHSMLTLEFFEQDPIPDSLENYFPETEDYLNYEPVKGRSRRSLLKLAAMLHDVGKPATRTIDTNGRIRFFDHNLEGAEIVGNIGKRLRMATREIAFLSTIVKDHMYPLGLIVFLRKPKAAKEKNRTIRRFIQRTGSEWLAILLLSYADLRATQGPWRKPDDLEKLNQLIGDATDIYFQQARSPMPRLVDGRDLMEEFGLSASPLIGELLKQVREAQMDGKVKTRDDAIDMVRSILSRH